MMMQETVRKDAGGAILFAMMGQARAVSALDNIATKQRYEQCLSLANLNPTEALKSAAEWSKAKGGAPAEHCLAMALTELKRYPEAAVRLDALGFGNRQQLEIEIVELDDAIVRPERMHVAHADRKAGARIDVRQRIEIAGDMHDMVGTAGHPAIYFTDENAVGSRNWLTMLPTI